MDNKKCMVEVFSRVTGFFRPVQSWNKGKSEEFKDRRSFDIQAASKGEHCGQAEKTAV